VRKKEKGKENTKIIVQREEKKRGGEREERTG